MLDAWGEKLMKSESTEQCEHAEVKHRAVKSKEVKAPLLNKSAIRERICPITMM
jgi:hypothetical protein